MCLFLVVTVKALLPRWKEAAALERPDSMGRKAVALSAPQGSAGFRDPAVHCLRADRRCSEEDEQFRARELQDL